MAPHLPVMIDECLEYFSDRTIKVFFDGTLGAGGHAQALLKAHPEIEMYIGCDRDTSALEIAKETLKPWADKVVFVHGNFADLDKHLEKLGVTQVDGFFFDLGVSSMQLDQGKRGFSFSKEGPLDMRMDLTQDMTAKQIVNSWPEKKLGELFRDFGEEPRWRQAAKAIAIARSKKEIDTTEDLAEIMKEAVGQKKRLHPATLVFQALRICVNKELDSVQSGIQKALQFLTSHGRIGVLSFHSLEDRIVKNIFREASTAVKRLQKEGNYIPMLEVLTKKPLICTRQEEKRNPRARSAKLRFAEKN